MTEKQIITDKERIQHLEEKIKRQRADLSRLYRERDERVEELERELAFRELISDRWYRLFEETRTKYRNLKAELKTLVSERHTATPKQITDPSEKLLSYLGRQDRPLSRRDIQRKGPVRDARQFAKAFNDLRDKGYIQEHDGLFTVKRYDGITAKLIEEGIIQE